VALALTLTTSAFGCQVAPPERATPLPVVRAGEVRRFALEGPEHEMEPSPLDLVGRTVREDHGAAPPDALEPGAAEPVDPAVLHIEDVLLSVEHHFPLILAALEVVEITEGKLLAARGGFDLVLGSKGRGGLQGFYENERFDVTFEQPTTLWGASLLGGYRVGRGDFADYDGKAKTLGGGEFRAGVSVPLLQGGRIDRRRLALWRARLERDQADPLVLQKRLAASRKAARSYWKWVAAGQKLEVARRLLGLAEDRQDAVSLAVEEGELAEIALVENRRLIVERQAILFGAERLVQGSSIELSLYYRDPDGVPVLPGMEAQPREFPVPRDPAEVLRDEDARIALTRRPEVLSLELERSRRELELELARNTLLPTLDLGVLASQDVGDDASTPDDKGPFELDTFLRFELPVQRRGAKGSTRAREAEIAKLDRNLQFVKERIVTEVQDASSALQQTFLRIAQVVENVQLAGRLEEAERLQLREGESDLLRVNLREQQTAAAAGAMIDVLAEHFRSLADHRAVLGIPYDEVLAGAAVGGGPR
jgi:outer membrane protein TolC